MSKLGRSPKRIVLKLSGEVLLGGSDYGIDPATLTRIATEIRDVREMGVQIAVVIGGGNLFRGAGLAEAGMDRVTGDQMGMLATVMNSLAMQDALEKLGVHARVMSALVINEVCEDYIRRRAIRHLEKSRVVLLAAGTGNPFFTTDTAASLRAIEIGADLLAVLAACGSHFLEQVGVAAYGSLAKYYHCAGQDIRAFDRYRNGDGLVGSG